MYADLGGSRVKRVHVAGKFTLETAKSGRVEVFMSGVRRVSS